MTIKRSPIISHNIDNILSQLVLLRQACFLPVHHIDEKGNLLMVGHLWTSKIAEETHNNLVQLLDYYVKLQTKELEKEYTHNGTEL